MFGRNAPCALGVTGVDSVSENKPRRVLAAELGAGKGVKFVHAACGRSHALLVDSEGNVWSAGANNLGQVHCVCCFRGRLCSCVARQCGHPVTAQITEFISVGGPYLNGERQHVVKAGAGISFSVVLTRDGKGRLLRLMC